jgi:hypothetical protein
MYEATVMHKAEGLWGWKGDARSTDGEDDKCRRQQAIEIMLQQLVQLSVLEVLG